ncbi:hypothetical protein E3T26_03810 [Cryobacterium sp. TMT1-21]|uniref:hypothetical protein n=1 Tax=unclassified Cryobacterium TaxID=2649013 RepID=UPI00106CD076|nr:MULTISPECIES: hypothetical protein [unclassified Cryobacterium]TFC88396.1 hypothetical protein E3T24_02670 [Cryobacterium sp. TmT2-59]TFD16582.1 hypothetical protein E3T26_03810 [Cryobacterium sp. TMT1-21]TFD18024.1 hypothetical protein E3T32_13120 [Cryobacterium sp. TMT2-23]TFD35823.1 hypothetical protein E3T37_15030 [Cryobacterium sp. TMT2-10]
MDPDALRAAEFDGPSVALERVDEAVADHLAAEGTKWMTGLGPDLERVLSAGLLDAIRGFLNDFGAAAPLPALNWTLGFEYDAVSVRPSRSTARAR